MYGFKEIIAGDCYRHHHHHQCMVFIWAASLGRQFAGICIALYSKRVLRISTDVFLRIFGDVEQELSVSYKDHSHVLKFG